MVVEIIAEVAQGYEGDPKLLSLLTKGALSTDCDSIKYQLVFADELATPDYEFYKLFKKLEMEEHHWVTISEIIKARKKNLYFDIFGLKSLKIAKKLNASGVKISTTEFYNQPLFSMALKSFEKIFLSVGGIPLDHIKQKLRAVESKFIPKINLLYGFQSEPTLLSDNNLRKLRSIKEQFPGYKTGFMDHSDGSSEDALLLSLVALGSGAEYIEKHITLDRALELEDFTSAISPKEFSEFVRRIRKYELSLGSSSLDLSEKELAYRRKATKSVVALEKIQQYDTLTIENVGLKRSSTSIDESSILKLEEVLGKKVNKDIDLHSRISREDI